MSVEEIPAQEAVSQPPVRELTPEEKAFAAAVVKRVRNESKRAGVPTRIADLEADAAGLDADGIKAAIDNVLEHNKDVGRLMVFNGAAFLFSEKFLDAALAESIVRAEELRMTIARKIRTAAEAGAPTAIDALRAISMDLSDEELEARLADLAADEDTMDIRRTVAFTGAVYFYSDRSIDQQRAEQLVRSEELQFKIVVEIRAESKYSAKLTKVEDLQELAPDLRPGEIEAELDAIQKIEMFGDIHVMSKTDGTLYAVSEVSMSQNYAGILLRIEENDPCYTIAETVREESRVYPRPTDVELFKYALFDIDRSRLDEHIADTLAKYDDIKRFEMSGAVYLYSDQFMTELQAQSLARKQNSDG